MNKNDLAALFRLDGQMAPSLDPDRIRSLTVEEGSTNKIVLPKGLSEQQAVEWLQKSIASKETEIRLRYVVPGYPVDAAIAFQTALDEVFGFTQLKGTWASPPALIQVPTGSDKLGTVILGRFSLPNIFGFLQTGIEIVSGQFPSFTVNVVTRKKHEVALNAFFEEVKKIQKTRSIYKGQIVRIDFTWLREGDNFDPDHHSPVFLPLPQARREDLVIEESSRRALEAAVWERLSNPDFFTQNGMALKYGALFVGPYGTGKTLAMSITAREAAEHGWTVLYLADVRDLGHALRFAELYAPAVIAAEDFDKAAGDGEDERSPQMNALLNQLDGLDTKTIPIITLLTTNHPERVHPAYRRPGRLDKFIVFKLPGVAEARELFRRCIGLALSPEATLERAAEKVTEMGMSPAFIRETAETAIIFTRLRLKAKIMDGRVTDEDVELAVAAMEPHLGLSLNGKDKTLIIPHEVAELASDVMLDIRAHLIRNGREA